MDARTPTSAIAAISLPQRCLTDRAVRALEPRRRQYQVRDSEARGLALRVNRTSKTWVLIGRFGSRNATRRKLGEYPAMSLREARAEALRWRALLAQGKDPTVGRASRGTRFGDIAEAFIADAKRRGLRQIHKDANELTRELKSWWDRPIGAIDRQDVLHVIEAVKARSLWQAHHVFSYMSRLFNWAVERGIVDRSPCHGLRPSRLIGAKVPRDRVLTDAELRALWDLCPTLGYPMGPLVRTLILTGQRRSEVAGMRWSEIHNGLWTIPRERMKMRTAHTVPLVPEVSALLEELPRFTGDYVFTTTHGRLPVNGFSKAKKQIDALMRAPPWCLHDLRRTMRTHLSALPVPDLVRELVIGHTKTGLHRVYDQYAYLEEKRQALTLWAERLLRMVGPPYGRRGSSSE